MIRFVDLRDQECSGNRFAWYDTKTDRFFEYRGCQAWDTMQEFSSGFKDTYRSRDLLERLTNLAPGWAWKESDDDQVRCSTPRREGRS